MTNSLSLVAHQLSDQVRALLAAPVLSSDHQPLDLLRASIELQANAVALVAAAVDDARASGCSWQVIGDTLGISRQAAFQRFGKPIDPRTGETMTVDPLPQAVDLATAIIADLTRGKWSEVTDRFDERMRDGLTPEALAAAWAQVIGMAGAYERHGQTDVARAADITITNTPLAFEADDFVARISFRDDQTVAGFYILPASAPAT